MKPGWSTHFVALNAEEPQAQWVHLLPIGEFSGNDGRGPYSVATADEAAGVVARSVKVANGRDLVVDFDHQTDFAAVHGVGGVAPAAGWIKELAARADGVWGRVEWTATAAHQLAERAYRFISPVFVHDHPDGGRVLALVRAGLTNTPNLRQLTAVASEEKTMDPAGALNELRKIYGLSASTPPDAVVEAARTATTTAASMAPDRYVPIALFENMTAQLHNASRGVSEEAANIAVNREIEAGRLLPSMRDWGVSLCRENRPAFDGFVQRTSGGLQALLTPLNHGALGRGPSPDDSRDAEIARRLGHTPEEMNAAGKGSTQ